MWKLLKTFFFTMDPEKAHYLSMDLISIALKIPIIKIIIKKSFQLDHPTLEKKIAGLHFKNPVGLAAGFDKDGLWLDSLSSLGFGFIEVGTVTPIAQSGNDKPRLFRLKKDEAIINRMGFNNQGVDALVARLINFRSHNTSMIIGGNIGKNKNSEGEQIIQDYVICFQKLAAHVDYFVINVSSPNTANLRALQDREPLDNLLKNIQQENKTYNKPIFLKIAPDLSDSALNDIIDVVTINQLTGIIATNTSVTRPEMLQEKELLHQAGGLSGKPIITISNNILKKISEHNNNLILIGVGGINSTTDAELKLDHGADLIQIYSGMIYQGPWFCKKIKSVLLNK